MIDILKNVFNFGNLLLWGVPVLFIGVAGILVLSAVYLTLRSMAAKSWPRTQGKVLSALVEKSYSDNTPYYRPLIAYQFQVNGHDYQCDHLAFGQRTGAEPDERGRLKAEEKAKQYPVGSTVQVFYNPGNPADAVLEVRTVGVGCMIGSAILLGIVGAGWWLGASWLIRQ